MGIVKCDWCGEIFKDRSPHLNGLKFCDRGHFKLYKKKHGSWNKGKVWKEMYDEKTYNKLKTRITSTGENHHLYGSKRPDVVIKNIINNPMYSKNKKEEIKKLVNSGQLTEKLILDMSKSLGYINKKFAYQRKAYEVYGEDCQICGATKRDIQIDVHHKDGDHTNNKIENLEVDCARCHALLHKNPDALPKSINTKESIN